MTHSQIMDKAVKIAKQSAAENEIPVGAVITLNGEIVATGGNTMEKDGNPTHHAEINAINGAVEKIGKYRLKDCTLYVTLEPCPMCAGAIMNCNIKKVVYGAYDNKEGCFGGFTDFSCMKFPYTPEIQSGYHEEECKNLITEFFDKLR